jgi:hypothetical protein
VLFSQQEEMAEKALLNDAKVQMSSQNWNKVLEICISLIFVILAYK